MSLYGKQKPKDIKSRYLVFDMRSFDSVSDMLGSDSPNEIVRRLSAISKAYNNDKDFQKGLDKLFRTHKSVLRLEE